MNRKETISIMKILKAAYPNFYRGMSMQDAQEIIDLWYDMFKNEPVGIVGAAVKAVIESDEQGYPPHIGAVKSKIRLITSKDKTTEMEAWNLVFNAICRGIYHSKEDFEKFPHEIQCIVGSHEQIKQWAMMEPNTVQSVIASNFQRSYREKMNKKDEIDKLPEDIKQLIFSTTEKTMLENVEV